MQNVESFAEAAQDFTSRPNNVNTRKIKQDSIDDDDDSDSDYDNFMPAGGGVMMWDDDEQYMPNNEPLVAL